MTRKGALAGGSSVFRTVTVFRRENRRDLSISWGFSVVLIFTVKNRENGENRLNVPIGQKSQRCQRSQRGAQRAAPLWLAPHEGRGINEGLRTDGR